MTKECFTKEMLAMSDTMYGVARTYMNQDADCWDDDAAGGNRGDFDFPP
jgi:hypothetical protein